MVEQARALFDEHGPFSVAQLVDRVPGFNALAPSELRAGRQTVQAMCNAGELVRVGARRVPGSRRPVNLYAPAVVEIGQPADTTTSGADALASAMQVWSGALPESTEV
jgi:hypothetical protein